MSNNPLSQNASNLIHVNLDPDSNAIEERDLQSKKQQSPNNSTDAEMVMSMSPLGWNASASIRIHLNFDPKITDENDGHSQKQRSPNSSTDLGITMPVTRVWQNARASIRCNFEEISSLRDLSLAQLRKQSETTIWAQNGIQTGSPENCPLRKQDPNRGTPLTTIIRRQNPFVISQATGETRDSVAPIQSGVERSLLMK
jgi:hypothetical protein